MSLRSSGPNSHRMMSMMHSMSPTGNSSATSSSSSNAHGGYASSQIRLSRDASIIRDLYNFEEEIGAGAFGRVIKATAKQNNNTNNSSQQQQQHTSSSSAGSYLSGGTKSPNPSSLSTSQNSRPGSTGGNIHNSNTTYYAIKHVDKRKAGASGLKSVLSEVETLALLNHPYIVRLQEVFQDKESLYIVMEYVPGGELASALKKLQSHRLHESVVRKITVCLLQALEYIHDQGIVHRDLKPANCLLSSDGTQVKIADFGFAVMVGPTSCLTDSCGTPAYLAPEIVNSQNYGKGVDMWALGVCVYLMLTGEYPFNETQSESLAESITRGSYNISGGAWEHDISAGARDFLSKLLVTDPGKRWTAQQCLNHSWIRVGRPGGNGGSGLDGLYAGNNGDYDDMESGSSQQLSRAKSGMLKLQHAIGSGGNGSNNSFGGSSSSNNGSGHHQQNSNNAPTARPKRGRMRLRIVFKGAVAAVRAALRLLFFIRLVSFRKEGLDSIPMFRSFSFVVTRRYTPPIPSQMNCKSIAPGNNKILGMIVSIFETCMTVEHLDLSYNKIDNLELVQHIVRAANTHPNLTTLNLDGNPIPPLAGRGLLRLARFHPGLKQLSVQGTSIGSETMSQIVQALKEGEKKHSSGSGSGGGGNKSLGGGSNTASAVSSSSSSHHYGSHSNNTHEGSVHSSHPGSGATSPSVMPLPNFSPSPPTTGTSSPNPHPYSSHNNNHHPHTSSSTTSASGASHHAHYGSSNSNHPHYASSTSSASHSSALHGSSHSNHPHYHSSNSNRMGSASTHSSSMMGSPQTTTNSSSTMSMSSGMSSPVNHHHYQQNHQQNQQNPYHTTSSASSSSAANHNNAATSSYSGGRPPVGPSRIISPSSKMLTTGGGGGGGSTSTSPSTMSLNRPSSNNNQHFLPPLHQQQSGSSSSSPSTSTAHYASSTTASRHHHQPYPTSSTSASTSPSTTNLSTTSKYLSSASAGGSSTSHQRSSSNSNTGTGSNTGGGASNNNATSSNSATTSQTGKTMPSYMAPLHSSRRPIVHRR